MDVLANKQISGGVSLGDGGTTLGCALALVMDEFAHGVLVVTAEGRLLHANRTGHHELQRKRVLAIRQNLLHTCMPNDARTLREALARAAEGKRSLIDLSTGQAAGLTVAVLPLKPDEPGRTPHAALLFARASVCEALMLCFFARSHGLTATEEHVLGILCQGFSAPQIAAQMKLAVSTVRSHVRSLCAKTHSSGVRQLVNRVAVLPPVAPPFWDQAMH